MKVNSFLLTLLLMMCSAVAFSTTIIDDKWWCDLNEDDLTANIVYYSGELSGAIEIPEIVVDDYTEYTVISIGQLFPKENNITSITLPNSIQSVADFAFGGCVKVATPIYNNHVFAYLPRTYTGTYEIPDGIKSIAGGAFWGCPLDAIIIPNSVTNIGRGAFGNNTLLSPALYNANIFAYMDGNHCPKSYSIMDGIRTIAEGAFSYCNDLKSVTLPNSLECIKADAFFNCYGLETIIIPENVNIIEAKAFRRCGNILSLTVVDNNATYDNRDACNAIIETSTNTLIVGFKNTIIPNTVTAIGEHAFEECNFTTFIVPENIARIGEYAFANCSNLSSITIPMNISTIEKYTFYGCSSLESISIPYDVESIDEYAFFDCSSLSSITCSSLNPPVLGNYVFYNVDKSIPLYVPYESIELYKTTNQWREFTNIQAIPTTVLSANGDPLNVGVYYTTFYNSTQRYVLPDNGTEAYVADLSGGELLLTRIAQGGQVLPNNVAVIFRAPSSTITLTETSAAGLSFSAENDLRGVDAVTPLEDLGLTRSTCYVLSGNNTDGVGFYQCNSDNLKAHKAYLPYAGAPVGAPRRMRFVFNNTADLDQVQRDQVQSTKILRNAQLIIIRNDVEYNVAGQIVK